jgi:hypothetical protein
MDKKLTFKLNKVLIEKAKKYAASHKRSLSQIIESFLQSLPEQYDFENDKSVIQISTFVKSMSSGIQISADLDYKVDYANHLAEKYI